MPQLTPTPVKARHHHWRRDLTELSALFAAVATADVVANLVAHGPDGPVLLVAASLSLVATAGFHVWWSRRRGHAPPLPADITPGPEIPGETVLRRMRTTVRDTPGSLGRVCTALADSGVDILTLQTHPLSDGTVDEFLLRVPASVTPEALARAVTAAGGRDIWTETADPHDLVDTPTRILGLATRTALDTAELPLALRRLFGRCTIRSVPAGAAGAPAAEDALEETSMRLRDPSGGTITVDRPYLPFTPSEFARARALVELDACLGPRMPDAEDVLTLPEGNEITVRRARPEDLPAALEMHRRCSPSTLAMRYHGPVPDAGRYLSHLLNPRFGRTLTVQTASGRLVGLGHLLWDGEENEVALLLEDAWQRRGIGSELLRKLVGLAEEAGRGSVYAVTRSTNTGMVATMRGLGLPLDYQVEDGTLVITATLPVAAVPPPSDRTESGRSLPGRATNRR